MRWGVLVIAFAAFMLPSTAKAECTLVSSGETRPTGTIIHNADHDVLQRCGSDGDWHAMTPLSETPPDPCETGPIGTRCVSDGAIYAGDAVGGVRMYAAPCDHGMAWNGSTCTGAQTLRQWKTTNTTTAGTTNQTDGLANTDAMATAGLTLHPAAEACRNAGAEWYLPSFNELIQLYENIVDQDGDSTPGGPLGGTFDFNISGTLPNGRYRSSTQPSFAQGNGLNVWFSDGTQDFPQKTVAYAVRCVRR